MDKLFVCVIGVGVSSKVKQVRDSNSIKLGRVFSLRQTDFMNERAQTNGKSFLFFCNKVPEYNSYQ